MRIKNVSKNFDTNQFISTIMEFAISAFIGAIIALAGSLGTTLLNHRCHRDSQKKELQKQKLERLLHLIYSLQTLTSVLNNQALDTSIDTSNSVDFESPTKEIEVISNLYFPSLKPYVDRVLLVFREYRLVTLRYREENIKNKSSENFDSFKSEITKFYRRLISETSILAKEAQKLIQQFD